MDRPKRSLDDVLAHYGIKGMKWGVRRTRKQIDADSEDASRVKATKAKARTNKTTSVLSNKELQDVITRMNLEQQYSRLTVNDTTRGKVQSTVKDLLGVGKTYNEVLNFANSPAGRQIKNDLFKNT